MSAFERDLEQHLTTFVEAWVSAMEGLGWMMWPEGQCGIASLTLVPALRVGFSGPWVVVAGTVGGHGPHAWIEGHPRGKAYDPVIVDPTARQFDPARPLVIEHCGRWALGYDRQLTISPEHETYLRSTISTYRRNGELRGKSGFKEIFGTMRRQADERAELEAGRQ